MSIKNNTHEKLSDEESVSQVENAVNLNSNPEARIKNPLIGIPRARLRDVEQFAKDKGLTDVLPMLSKGAICKSFVKCFNPCWLRDVI